MRLPSRTHGTCGGFPLGVGSPHGSLRPLSSVVNRLRGSELITRVAPLTALLFAFLLVSFLPAIVGSFSVPAQANVANGTIQGMVRDQSGASIPKATVTITNRQRGFARTAKTENDGAYRVALLQPGTYELRVEAAGFLSQLVANVVVTVGELDAHDFTLTPAEVSATVNIAAIPDVVDTSRTQQAETIERNQITSLPNLSRNFTSYIFTLPGITDVAAARVQQSRVTQIQTSGFSVGAGSGRSNYFSIDGGENESGVGSLRIRNLSVDAIQEFQVNRNAYSAEYGFTAGTAINVVTRAGANAFHGSGYGFYRSQKLAARDPLNPTGKKAFEQRISPGFTLSGPVVRNKTFFFSSFEALKYDVARLRAYTNNAALLIPTSAQSAYLQTLASGVNATNDSRRIAGLLQASLTTANYPQTMSLLQQSEGQFVAPSRAYNWATRIDYNRSQHDSFDGHFILAHENNDLLTANNVQAPTMGMIETIADQTIVGTWNHIFSNSLVNQFRTQFAHDDYKQVSRAPQSTNVAIAGLISYGRLTTVPLIINQQRYQFDDTLSWSHGSKEFKLGASYRPVDADITTEIGLGGLFTFAGGLPITRALSSADTAILTGSLAPPADTSLTSIQAFNFGLPASWQQGFGNPSFSAWQHNFGGFTELSWRATRQLTLNLGARLNFDGEPQPFQHNVTVSPRIGFSWDPFGKGKTVIRGGFGTFYAPVGLQVLLSARLQSPSGQYLNLPSRTLQDGAQSSAALWAYGLSIGKLPFIALTDADVRAFGIIPGVNQPNQKIADAAADYHNPYTVQASVGLSQQLAKDLVFELGIDMYHGVHLPLAIEGNYRENGQFVTVPGMPGSDLFGPQLVRIDPAIAQEVIHSSEGNSIYYGMTASLRKQFTRGFQFQTNYTYSKAIDDVVDFSSGTTPYLPTRRNLERGLSAYDLRHNFVASGSYTTPFDLAANNWLERAFADLTLSPIISLRNGFPFNLYIGRDVNGDFNTTDRPFYAPRNSGIGQNYYSVDLRLSKRIHLPSTPEGSFLEFIVEGTNLLNRANYLRVNDVVCGTSAQPGFINGCDPKFLHGPFDFKGVQGLPPTAPLGFVTAAPARQFQLGLRLEL
jgi:carboxypeptidase family protein